MVVVVVQVQTWTTAGGSLESGDDHLHTPIDKIWSTYFCSRIRIPICLHPIVSSKFIKSAHQVHRLCEIDHDWDGQKWPCECNFGELTGFEHFASQTVSNVERVPTDDLLELSSLDAVQDR